MRKRCRIERYLTAYADRELSARLRRKVEAHLESCPGCSSELDLILAADRLLRRVELPRLADGQWTMLKRNLSHALDGVDREVRKSARIREVRPVYGAYRRRAVAIAGVCAAVAIFVLAIGPASVLNWRIARDQDGNDCIVDSIETLAAGYTPMFFTSEDPEMTIIWVFSEETEPDLMGESPGAP
ncbi:MAG: zf-HC2 domain-containing protein [Gammaproteobacteria bacterium]|nr:zf-HC2 domain-containing protein [Gammaproteobacteria bacterium]